MGTAAWHSGFWHGCQYIEVAIDPGSDEIEIAGLVQP
jgi:hypothetical protein